MRTFEAVSYTHLDVYKRQFEHRLAGSPIRRIGHTRWLRNIAIALGNATPSPSVLGALRSRLDHPSSLVREHVTWAVAKIESETP